MKEFAESAGEVWGASLVVAHSGYALQIKVLPFLLISDDQKQKRRLALEAAQRKIQQDPYYPEDGPRVV